MQQLTADIPAKPTSPLYPPVQSWDWTVGKYNPPQPRTGKLKKYKGKVYIDVTVQAVLPDTFKSGSFCHEFSNVSSMINHVGDDAVALLSAAMIARNGRESTAAMCLRQILESLPVKRDWLDPDLEKLAREITKR